MGVDLGSLVVKRPLDWDDVSGKRVAIDAYNTLYQFLATIRQPDGTPLMDDQGRVTSHLSGLFQRTGHMVEHGIRPVYVFDGAPHELKQATLAQRRRIKEAAQAAYEKALEAGDLETARSKAQQTARLLPDMVQESKGLLDALGVPWIQAPSEGEAQAAEMVQRGLVDAVASQDYDSVLFGAPLLWRNLSVGGRRKLPGKQAWIDVPPEQIALDETLTELSLTREQVVDLALLLGTDYNPGVKGIGPKTAVKLLREEGSLEAVLERSAHEETGATWAKIRNGREGLEPLEVLRAIFLEPTVDSVQAPAWGPPEPDAVRRLLVDKHRFSRERIESGLHKYGSGNAQAAQRSLGEF